jgi:hypothetical protein
MRGWADCVAEEQDNADHSGGHTEKIKTEEHNNAYNKARFTQARTQQKRHSVYRSGDHTAYDQNKTSRQSACHTRANTRMNRT